MNANILKFLAGAGLNGLWAALVFTGKADANPLIAAIGTQLSAVLGYHAITNLQAVTPPRALPPLPTIPLQDK